MTVSLQNPQVQYSQAVAAAQAGPQQQTPTLTKEAQMAQNIQNEYACQAYSHNPYLCASASVSPLVLPQGTVQMPTTIPQNLVVQANQELPAPGPSVNYNQITPYLNGNSAVFQPTLQTQSGAAISTAAIVSQPISAQEAQLVYQGPIKNINPQVTPIEQYDNEINKQYQQYFLNKAEVNEELRNAVKHSTGKPSSFLEKLAKVAALLLAATAIYKFRNKIPIIKRFFK